MYGSTSQKPLENTSVKHHLGINYHFNGNILFGKGKFHIQNIAVKLSFREVEILFLKTDYFIFGTNIE